MTTFVALLRGINVGGKNILPMKELKTVLDSLGLKNIKTYIQSGNVIFDAANDAANDNGLARQISTAIAKSHGFEPRLWLLSKAVFDDAIKANPFKGAQAEPKTLHLYFLADIPQNPQLTMLEGLAKENEDYKLIGKVFYLHAPDGIGRSKLAEKVEKALGVAATARNWRTLSKLKERLES